MSKADYTVRVADSVSALPAQQWDALNSGGNPFTSHAFLSVLEESGSVGGDSGWIPVPIVFEDDDAQLIAAMPAYLKEHSQGEFVFDHSWADAWHRAGGRYYPKLQISAPFTPATGPRLLARDEGLFLPLIHAAQELCENHGLSSAHATFLEPSQVSAYETAGWLLRHDIQFHWENRGYRDFDDFLAALSSRKRKDLRKERARAQDGIAIRALTGPDIRPEHWDAFWQFYIDTGMRKWGQLYLTREAFSLLGERMAENILLILAFVDDQPVAGALNFIGGDALYGRYWGAVIDKPFLHFELCYYQAIDAAIAMGLSRVEAGAQGGHKLARGYAPVATVSAHFLPDENFRAAVAQFLEQERLGVARDTQWLAGRAPFRKAD